MGMEGERLGGGEKWGLEGRKGEVGIGKELRGTKRKGNTDGDRDEEFIKWKKRKSTSYPT